VPPWNRTNNLRPPTLDVRRLAKSPRKFENQLCMKTQQDPTGRTNHGARVACGVITLLVIGLGCAEPARTIPHIRLVLVEHHWSGWGGDPRRPDTSVIDVAVGDSLGTTSWCFCQKPLVLVGVLPGGEALVRYAECLSYRRSDSSRGVGPIGPETLVVRSTWARLATNSRDAGCEFAIRLFKPGRTDSLASGLWHDRYSEDFPALGDWVELDARPEVLQRTQPVCPDRLASRRMRLVALMWILVSKEGTVLATRSFDSDSLVIASADDCVRQWTYRPGRNKGKPVASWLNVDVEVCPGPQSRRR
jgi:hypothetical protein